jgi:hypothetical protein
VIAITARAAVAVTLVRVRTGTDDACAVVWVPRQPLCRGIFWRTFVSEGILAGAQRPLDDAAMDRAADGPLPDNVVDAAPGGPLRTKGPRRAEPPDGGVSSKVRWVVRWKYCHPAADCRTLIVRRV